MVSSGVQRKLTAILCADVVGYSRLMGADEEATIQTLTAYRKVFVSYIQQHRGRVVNAPGDALLAEFTSVVGAVECAVEVQRELAEKNSAIPADRRMDFRIGLNLGDVVVKDEDIYGDGVNIAARLESLADPGGICISGRVYDQIENKLALEYDDLGEKKVKNIARPIRVYRLLSKPGDAAHRVVQAKGAVITFRRGAIIGAGVLILLAAAGGIWSWNFFLDSASGPGGVSPIEKPYIAVLPFENMSADAEQEYFADGFAEDLITALSQVSGLRVTARNSSFVYKGQAVNVQRVGQELGVGYVLEGSVRRAGGRLRVTVQLIDARGGHHLWAKRYDREVKDLFALHDELVRQVVSVLEVQLTMGEAERIQRGTTDSVEAWEYYRKAMALQRKETFSVDPMARELLEKALEIDPEFKAALLGLGWLYVAEMRRFVRSVADPLGEAEALARRVRRLDERLAEPLALLGAAAWRRKLPERAIRHFEQAIALEPGHWEVRAWYGRVQCYSGNPEQGLAQLHAAKRLNPYLPWIVRESLGLCYYLTGRNEEAILLLSDVLSQIFHQRPYAVLLAAYGASGLIEEGRGVVRQTRENIDPTSTASMTRRRAYTFFSMLGMGEEALKRIQADIKKLRGR